MINEKREIERALLTVPEACESLGVSRSKLYDLISRGMIRTVKLSSGPKGGCVYGHNIFVITRGNRRRPVEMSDDSLMTFIAGVRP